MGYNSTLLVLNDALHLIKDDKDFGKKVHDAISGFTVYGAKDISSGYHCNAARVISCEHADATQVIAVGGNYGQVLADVWYTSKAMHTDEGKIELLKELADRFGYTLRKKPSKKKN